jgi:hypothetical protein
MKDAYVSLAQMGNCKACGGYQDLRLGTCFTCAPKITGVKISEVTHKLWHIDNPTEVWYYSENHN